MHCWKAIEKTIKHINFINFFRWNFEGQNVSIPLDQIVSILFASNIFKNLKIFLNFIDDLREEPTNYDPEEGPIIRDSKRTLPLRNLKRTLSPRNVKKNLSMGTPTNFRTLNDLCTTKDSFWLFGKGIW